VSACGSYSAVSERRSQLPRHAYYLEAPGTRRRRELSVEVGHTQAGLRRWEFGRKSQCWKRLAAEQWL